MSELIVMVGLQAAGKSTWVREHLAVTHLVVSKDAWPNARRKESRQQRMVGDALAAGHDVVVDNTNPSLADRAPLLALARAHGVRARAVFLDVPFEVCLRRNAVRSGRAAVPVVGLYDVRKRLVPPTTAEGFDTVEVVRQST